MFVTNPKPLFSTQLIDFSRECLVFPCISRARDRDYHYSTARHNNASRSLSPRTVSTFALFYSTIMDVADSSIEVAQVALPLLAGAGIGVLGAKFVSYSQLEVVRTSMLSRHVKPGGAKVLQLGGTTRDLFYYPQGTVQITVVGEDLTAGLWEQAGLQAGVPVKAVKSNSVSAALSSMPGSIYDSVVILNQHSLDPTHLAEIYRVLKPGGTFIFMQRIASSSQVASLARIGITGTEPHKEGIGDRISELIPWEFCQWDVAAASTDPHEVGVAIKSLQPRFENDDFSVNTSTFEQVMKRGRGRGRKNPSTGFGGDAS